VLLGIMMIMEMESTGLILLTGCAHFKLSHILKAVKKVFMGRPIHAVIGGFHLKTEEEGVIAAELFKKEGVRLVSPCHCTKKPAKEALREILGEAVYRENGSGTTFAIH
ncbi:MAG: hypothetical protein ACFFD8_10825, partial [Candidatus Thorarchaeota archaeon]